MINKEERRRWAKNHTALMTEYYSEEIRESVINTRIYDRKDFEFPIAHTPVCEIPQMLVVEDTTDGAVLKYSEGYNTCALNFASYTRPGGGFINGAIAQEEAICHKSNLYNILCKFEDLYNENYRNDGRNPLYRNWALYSPNVIFCSESMTDNNIANVITCPAPNYSRYSHNSDISPEEDVAYYDTLHSRIKYVLDIAKYHNQDILILGAFGCGVFGNNPTVVATIFKELLSSREYNFKKVYFAIPKGDNLNAFKKVFTK